MRGVMKTSSEMQKRASSAGLHDEAAREKTRARNVSECSSADALLRELEQIHRCVPSTKAGPGS